MRAFPRTALALLIGLSGALAMTPVVRAKTLCTVIADAGDGRILLQEGEACGARVTPASTFKIPLSLMGFDAGFLQDETAPKLPYREGYVAWGGKAWTQPTDPARWMRYSVVWFSQQITGFLGAERLHRYAAAFGYGNADLSGDPGKDNGLERSWIASSLTISPLEQIAFLDKLVNRRLPVSAQAMDMTRRIVQPAEPGDGWVLKGKTGGAFPRRKDGSFDRARGWGWYVGWAEKDGRTLVFVRLTQDEKRQKGSPGTRARKALLANWPALAARALAPGQ